MSKARRAPVQIPFAEWSWLVAHKAVVYFRAAPDRITLDYATAEGSLRPATGATLSDAIRAAVARDAELGCEMCRSRK